MRKILVAAALMVAACSPWRSDADLVRLFDEGRASGVVTVGCTGGSDARAELWLRTERGWKRAGCCSAYIGRCGLGKTREGDGMTPEGEFGVGKAFGALPDPGTALDFIALTPTVVACDEPGRWYNMIVDTSEPGVECGGERMADILPQYNYGLEITYNPERIWPLGSAIFLHCKGEKKSTAGCVAVDESFMVKVLETADPSMRIVIRPR